MDKVENVTKEPFIVKGSEFKETRLINNDGNFYPKFNVLEAIKLAESTGLDLVCFNEPLEDSLALCKILDYGKWKYSQIKHKKEVEKKQKHKTKEICFSPTISIHDIQHKLSQVKSFLNDGDNVLLVMQVNTLNHRHMFNANQKIEEIMGICNEFSKEVSRKSSERQISINLIKK